MTAVILNTPLLHTCHCHRRPLPRDSMLQLPCKSSGSTAEWCSSQIAFIVLHLCFHHQSCGLQRHCAVVLSSHLSVHTCIWVYSCSRVLNRRKSKLTSLNPKLTHTHTHTQNLLEIICFLCFCSKLENVCSYCVACLVGVYIGSAVAGSYTVLWVVPSSVDTAVICCDVETLMNWCFISCWTGDSEHHVCRRPLVSMALQTTFPRGVVCCHLLHTSHWALYAHFISFCLTSLRWKYLDVRHAYSVELFFGRQQRTA